MLRRIITGSSKSMYQLCKNAGWEKHISSGCDDFINHLKRNVTCNKTGKKYIMRQFEDCRLLTPEDGYRTFHIQVNEKGTFKLDDKGNFLRWAKEGDEWRWV